MINESVVVLLFDLLVDTWWVLDDSKMILVYVVFFISILEINIYGVHTAEYEVPTLIVESRNLSTNACFYVLTDLMENGFSDRISQNFPNQLSKI